MLGYLGSPTPFHLLWAQLGLLSWESPPGGRGGVWKVGLNPHSPQTSPLNQAAVGLGAGKCVTAAQHAHIP